MTSLWFSLTHYLLEQLSNPDWTPCGHRPVFGEELRGTCMPSEALIPSCLGQKIRGNSAAELPSCCSQLQTLGFMVDIYIYRTTVNGRNPASPWMVETLYINDGINMKKHVSTGAGFLPSTVVNEDYIKQLRTGGTTLWRGSGHVGAMVGPWFQHHWCQTMPVRIPKVRNMKPKRARPSPACIISQRTNQIELGL